MGQGGIEPGTEQTKQGANLAKDGAADADQQGDQHHAERERRHRVHAATRETGSEDENQNRDAQSRNKRALGPNRANCA